MPTGFTKTITLTNGQPATIAKLNWLEMKEARKKASAEQVDDMRQLGGELIRVFREMESPEKAHAAVDVLEARAKVEQQKALDDPKHYDMDVVLSAGVLNLDGKTPIISELDEPVADELREAIVAFSRARGDRPNA